MVGFYGVAVGRRTGVYATWSEAEQQIKGFSNAQHKKFRTKVEALDYVEIHRTDPDDADSLLDRLNSLHLADNETNRDVEELRELHRDDLVAFCAGSAPDNGRDGGTAAYAVSFPLEDNRMCTARLVERPTNNRADCLAAKAALSFADELDPTEVRTLVIYSRYQILISAMGKKRWVDTWARKRWRKADKKPVINCDIYRELLDAETSKRVTEWRFLKMLPV